MCGIWDWQSTIVKDLNDSRDRKHTLFCRKNAFVAIYALFQTTNEEFFLDQAYAIHLYNAHKIGYDCVHCKKYFPGGDEMYSIHLQLCKAPCDGHPRCPCLYPKSVLIYFICMCRQFMTLLTLQPFLLGKSNGLLQE